MILPFGSQGIPGRRRLAVFAVVCSLGALAACEVNSSGSISNICVDRVTGQMRAATKCGSREVPSQIAGTGVAGPAGPQGPAGPSPTVSIAERTVTVDAMSRLGIVTNCPASGQQVVSGGVDATDVANDEIVLMESYPETNRWVVVIRSEEAVNIPVKTYAICLPE